MSRNKTKTKLPSKSGAKGGRRKANLHLVAGKRKRPQTPPANASEAKVRQLVQTRLCWCAVCGRSFRAKRSHAQTCGEACRQALSRRRRKERGVV